MTGFYRRGGNAAWRAEIEMEGHRIAVADHKFYARQSAYVGDLVGIADGGDGAVDNGEAGKFGGGEEGGFDVYMGVDEPGEDIGGVVRKHDGRGFGGIGRDGGG